MTIYEHTNWDYNDQEYYFLNSTFNLNSLIEQILNLVERGVGAMFTPARSVVGAKDHYLTLLAAE